MSKTTRTTKAVRGEKKERRFLSAREKMEAVLSVWSERRKPTEVCKELGVQWTSLSHWQDRAMAAMMEALEPRTRKEEDRGPALSPRMEKLLARTEKRTARLSKFEKRLERIQQKAAEAEEGK